MVGDINAITDDSSTLQPADIARLPCPDVFLSLTRQRRSAITIRPSASVFPTLWTGKHDCNQGERHTGKTTFTDDTCLGSLFHANWYTRITSRIIAAFHTLKRLFQNQLHSIKKKCGKVDMEVTHGIANKTRRRQNTVLQKRNQDTINGHHTQSVGKQIDQYNVNSNLSIF